jgi:hypothetical protein
MDMEKLFERLTARMDADRKATQEDLLAKLDVNQAKAEAKRKTDKEEIRSNQAKLLATIEAAQEKADAYQVQMQEMMKMMHANQAKAEVPEENATVMPVEEPKKKRRRDR